MERTEILDMMAELRLFGMRAAYDETLATALKRQHEPQRFIGDLLRAEISEKQARSIKYQLAIAKLPLAKDIDDFAFKGTPINEALVRTLADGGFLAQQRNTVFKFVLEPILEARFHPASFGFRPGRGAKDALRVVDRLVKSGCCFVVDADLKSYGNCYADKQDLTTSQNFLDSARMSFVSLDDLVGQSHACESLARVYIESQCLEEAILVAQNAERAAIALGNAKEVCQSCATLALAQLVSDKLTMAEDAVTTALHHPYLRAIPYAWIVRGILALKQRKHKTAADAFNRALESAKLVSEGKQESVGVLAPQALALEGLAKLTGETILEQLLPLRHLYKDLLSHFIRFRIHYKILMSLANNK